MNPLLLSILIGMVLTALLMGIGQAFYKVWRRTNWFPAEVISYILICVLWYPSIFLMRIFPGGSADLSRPAIVGTVLFDVMVFASLAYVCL